MVLSLMCVGLLCQQKAPAVEQPEYKWPILSVIIVQPPLSEPPEITSDFDIKLAKAVYRIGELEKKAPREKYHWVPIEKTRTMLLYSKDAYPLSGLYDSARVLDHFSRTPSFLSTMDRVPPRFADEMRVRALIKNPRLITKEQLAKMPAALRISSTVTMISSHGALKFGFSAGTPENLMGRFRERVLPVLPRYGEALTDHDIPERAKTGIRGYLVHLYGESRGVGPQVMDQITEFVKDEGTKALLAYNEAKSRAINALTDQMDPYGTRHYPEGGSRSELDSRLLDQARKEAMSRNLSQAESERRLLILGTFDRFTVERNFQIVMPSTNLSDGTPFPLALGLQSMAPW